MWTDVYKLFDINYLMKNDEGSWNKFWKQAEEIVKKHGNPPHLMEMITLAAQMIEDRMKAEQKNEALLWKADEPYPYPKEGE
jgi:hypothetical protein